MLISGFKPLCAVSLPAPTQERQHYMWGFDVADPTVPPGFEDYLQTVKDLVVCAMVTAGKAFLTIDEKIVKAGMSQRRPGPHVDGQFMSDKAGRDWRHGGGGWNHGCNAVPLARMPVIVASSVAGCRAWTGIFDGEPKNNGDLSHIADQLDEGTVLKPGVGYQLSPDCVHESMKFEADTPRTFIRIALPIQ